MSGAGGQGPGAGRCGAACGRQRARPCPAAHGSADASRAGHGASELSNESGREQDAGGGGGFKIFVLLPSAAAHPRRQTTSQAERGGWELQRAHPAGQTRGKTFRKRSQIPKSCPQLGSPPLPRHEAEERGTPLRAADAVCFSFPAERHAGCPCVTASMDDIYFEHTIR